MTPASSAPSQQRPPTPQREVRAPMSSPLAEPRGLGSRAPFRWSRADHSELPVEVRGELPAWLRGTLVRTAPAVFERGDMRAQHWFDGLGLLYAFELGHEVRFRQQLVQSRTLEAADAGRSSQMAHFAVPASRSPWQRLLRPLPAEVTDNTNVNVIPWGGDWLALTETPHQHVVDGGTLRSKGLARYTDDLPAALTMIAHPHYDARRRALVNVGLSMGPRSEVFVYRQHEHSGERVVEGRLRCSDVPYVHDFGLSDDHAVVIDHPLRFKPWKMLFSNRPFAAHLAWQQRSATRLHRLDRRTGEWAVFETRSLFCFHTVRMFEQGDDVVLDLLAYDDAAIVQALRVESLLRELPRVAPRYVRVRLPRRGRDVEVETLSSTGFEFPRVSPVRVQGRPYAFAWGAELGSGWSSRIVKVQTRDGAASAFSDPDFTYGEPVFVPRPGASEEDDGVLLTVGSHLRDERARLSVLDARSLTPLASCDAGLCLPLGFHGNFQSAPDRNRFR